MFAWLLEVVAGTDWAVVVERAVVVVLVVVGEKRPDGGTIVSTEKDVEECKGGDTTQ